jgi:peptidyl-prolyl cis-trans isomerase C
MNVAPALRMPTPLAIARAATAAICFAMLMGTTGPSVAETQTAIAETTQTSDPVIAIVNGTKLHESDLAAVNQMIGRNIPALDKVERRASVLQMMIDGMLLAHVADERKIVDEADLQRRITFARNQGLADNLLIVTAKQAVTDDSVRKAYDELLKNTKPEPEVHLRQIIFLVKNAKDDAAVKAAQEKAEAAVKRLKNGEDFATVFTAVSDDAAVAAQGGDAGWRIRAELGKEIADAAFTLKAGEVSSPIKTSAGFHIIKIEEQRERKPATFEEIKDRLAGMLASRAQFELINQLRDSAKIERFDAPAADKTTGKSTGNKTN